MGRRRTQAQEPAPQDQGADQWDDENQGQDTGLDENEHEGPNPEDLDEGELSDEERREAAMSGSGVASIGPALTADQASGLDPIDEEAHLDEAARRSELTNMQTEHERTNGLDAVSGTPNPGVTQKQSDAHTQPGKRGSDMGGRPPMPDPLKALDSTVLAEVRNRLRQAEAQDRANAKAGNEDAARRSAGWRNLRDLGMHKATLDALVAAGEVETDNAPGMAHMPDTGKVYRLKLDRG